MSLMRDILSGVWMISEQEANALMPVVNRMIQGENVDFSPFVVKESAYGLRSESSDDKASEKKGVFVIPVKGIITKYDACWEMGMVTFERYLKEAKMDENIGAVVLDMDTGGGEASYMIHVAKAMQELRAEKPILTYFSGYCASAGYYIASQSTKIYASDDNDIVGSIGTMARIIRPNPENKTADFIIESIYATKSTMKNHDFEEAWKGNHKPFKENQLDPLNEQFHEMVKIGRPQLSEEAFTGVSMISSKAIEMNFIDGIKSFDEVISEAFSLIKS
jgi:protease-4